MAAVAAATGIGTGGLPSAPGVGLGGGGPGGASASRIRAASSRSIKSLRLAASTASATSLFVVLFGADPRLVFQRRLARDQVGQLHLLRVQRLLLGAVFVVRLRDREPQRGELLQVIAQAPGRAIERRHRRRQAPARCAPP